MTKLRIVFAGTPDFAIPCLDALYRAPHELIALYTQPDRPAGRGRKLTHSAVKTWGLAHDIPLYQPAHFKTPEAIQNLAALQPDLMVVIAYGLILPAAVLAIPRLGCINVHASLLPRWRGASPIQQALLAQDSETGITIMQMDSGMDTGASLKQRACHIIATDTTASLQERLSQLAPDLLLETIVALANGQAIAQAQSTANATYAPKINKQDAAIHWQQPARAIDAQIRAYYPWPIAYTEAADLRIRIHQAHIMPYQSPAAPGTILDIHPAGLLVNTGQNAILITRLQCPGGKAMAVADYLHAHQHTLARGMVLQ